jgi:phage tail protein X
MHDLPEALFESQHGLATTEQLLAAGLTKHHIRRLIDYGRLTRVSPRLLRLPGSPPSEPQKVLAAVLDAGPGTALSHTSALAWWQVPGFAVAPLHVTHARDGVHRPRRLAAFVHDVSLLPEDHVLVLNGVPVVSPARALFDVAGLRSVPPRRVERAVDNAWSCRLVSGRTLQAMFTALAARGRPGIATMRKILDSRGADYVPPASGLEHRVEQILRDRDQPTLRRQVDSGDESGWIGRIDFADDQVPFRLEVQSERFHSSLLDRHSDRDRLARLTAAGFVVATVTDFDVWHRPARVVEVVCDGRRAARRATQSRAA